MAYVSPELKQRITNKLQEGIDRATAHYKRSFRFPTVVYERSGRVAGTANYRTNTINFNSTLLIQNVDKFIESTVPHELAHLICVAVHPETVSPAYRKRSLHGDEWRSVMRILGVREITRCHSYDTSTVSKPRHNWQCSCGKQFQLSTRMHNQLIVNPKARRHCASGTLSQASAPTPRPAITASYAPVVDVVRNGVATFYASKLDHCKALFRAHATASRSDLINMFVQQAKCTAQGAATYYATCKKLHG